MKNPYSTFNAVVESIHQETPKVRSFVLRRTDGQSFKLVPGQVIALSLPGHGESVFAPSEVAQQPKKIEIAVQQIGRVTSAIHKLKVGDTVGLRGPFGHGFDVDRLLKQDLLVIAGGLGIIPLRSLLRHLTANFCQRVPKRVQLFYGARSYDDLLFKRELPAWKKCLDIEVTLSKPYPDTDRGWRSHAGMLPTLFHKVETIDEGAAVLCGPPVMFRGILPKVLALGFKPESIYLSLERRMQCAGQGTCQHCAIGPYYVCEDGPVFQLSTIINTPQFEAYQCA